jgi:hypothetical protein
MARGRHQTNAVIRWNINLHIDVAKTIRVVAVIIMLGAAFPTIPDIRPAIVRYVLSTMAADAPVDPQSACDGRRCCNPSQSLP